MLRAFVPAYLLSLPLLFLAAGAADWLGEEPGRGLWYGPVWLAAVLAPLIVLGWRAGWARSGFAALLFVGGAWFLLDQIGFRAASADRRISIFREDLPAWTYAELAGGVILCLAGLVALGARRRNGAVSAAVGFFALAVLIGPGAWWAAEWADTSWWRGLILASAVGFSLALGAAGACLVGEQAGAPRPGPGRFDRFILGVLGVALLAAGLIGVWGWLLRFYAVAGYYVAEPGEPLNWGVVQAAVLDARALAFAAATALAVWCLLRAWRGGTRRAG